MNLCNVDGYAGGTKVEGSLQSQKCVHLCLLCDVFDKIFNPTNCVVTQDYDNDFGTHCIRLSAYILTGMQMYAVFSPKRSPES